MHSPFSLSIKCVQAVVKAMENLGQYFHRKTDCSQPDAPHYIVVQTFPRLLTKFSPTHSTGKSRLLKEQTVYLYPSSTGPITTTIYI